MTSSRQDTLEHLRRGMWKLNIRSTASLRGRPLWRPWVSGTSGKISTVCFSVIRLKIVKKTNNLTWELKAHFIHQKDHK